MLKGTTPILNRCKKYANDKGFWRDSLDLDFEAIEEEWTKFDYSQILNKFHKVELNLLAFAAPRHADLTMLSQYYQQNKELVKILLLLKYFSSKNQSTFQQYYGTIPTSYESYLYKHPGRPDRRASNLQFLIVKFLTEPLLLIKYYFSKIIDSRGFRTIDISNLNDDQKQTLFQVSKQQLTTICDNLRNEFRSIQGRYRFIRTMTINGIKYHFIKMEYTRGTVTRLEDNFYANKANWLIISIDDSNEIVKFSTGTYKQTLQFLGKTYSHLFPDKTPDFDEQIECYSNEEVLNFIEKIMQDEDLVFNAISMWLTPPEEEEEEEENVESVVLTIDGKNRKINNFFKKLQDLDLIEFTSTIEVEKLTIIFNDYKYKFTFRNLSDEDDEPCYEILLNAMNKAELDLFQDYVFRTFNIETKQGPIEKQVSRSSYVKK